MHLVIKVDQLLSLLMTMNIWRKIVTLTLILALPVSSWATVMMNPHCQTDDNTSHTEMVQVDDSDTLYMDGHIVSDDASHAACDGCEDNMNCSVSICSASAMFDSVVMVISDQNHFDFQRMSSFAHTMGPALPYRPPIIFS